MFNNQITEAFYILLRYPNAPKAYRILKEYFKKQNMLREAEAFESILIKKSNKHDDVSDIISEE